MGVERRALRPDAMPPSCLLSSNQPQHEASREGVSLAMQSDGVPPDTLDGRPAVIISYVFAASLYVTPFAWVSLAR